MITHFGSQTRIRVGHAPSGKGDDLQPTSRVFRSGFAPGWGSDGHRVDVVGRCRFKLIKAHHQGLRSDGRTNTHQICSGNQQVCRTIRRRNSLDALHMGGLCEPPPLENT